MSERASERGREGVSERASVGGCWREEAGGGGRRREEAKGRRKKKEGGAGGRGRGGCQAEKVRTPHKDVGN